jgi:hypothetical protein
MLAITTAWLQRFLRSGPKSCAWSTSNPARPAHHRMETGHVRGKIVFQIS